MPKNKNWKSYFISMIMIKFILIFDDRKYLILYQYLFYYEEKRITNESIIIKIIFLFNDSLGSWV